MRAPLPTSVFLTIDTLPHDDAACHFCGGVVPAGQEHYKARCDEDGERVIRRFHFGMWCPACGAAAVGLAA